LIFTEVFLWLIVRIFY